MIMQQVPNKLWFTLLISSLLFFHVAATTDTDYHLCLHEERSALWEFKQSFTIERYANSSFYHKTDSWKLGGDCCRSWDGVECDETSGHVIGLDLSTTSGDTYMYGSLSSNASLFRLLHLQKLNLANNDFSYSQIPTEIGLLSSLTHLNLSQSLFSGQIPLQLSNLITSLDLSDNALNGEIPTQVANLTQLAFLDLSYNQLTGHIPSSLSSLIKLESLSLGHNELIGQVPSFFTNFTQLRDLSLSFNRFQGPLPNSFSNLKKLQVLDLFSNNLNSTVELDMFHKLKELRVLALSRNNLSVLVKDDDADYVIPNKYECLGLGSCNLGKFPTFLRYQNKLVCLDLSSNNIHGEIPKWIWNISSKTLNYFNISHNLLTSFEEHPSLLPWGILVNLDISFNRLQGSLPLPPLSTSYYFASNNLWSADLSPLFCNLSNLIVLDISNNRLSGTLPQCLSSSLSNSLFVLNLQNNSFYGTIPESWGLGCALGMINLNQNQFYGEIPTSLCNCTKLEFIDFGHNQIHDTFPSWLGVLPELRVLIIRSNNFHGVFEKHEKDFEFSELRILDLSYNDFSSSLSSLSFHNFLNSMKVVDEKMAYMKTSLGRNVSWSKTVGYYDYSMKISNKGMERMYSKIPNIFKGIDLSNNHFEGEIPTSIGNLKGLHLLSLGNNNFTGGIPSSFGNLLQLESLDLSHNKLSGKIPRELLLLNFLSFFDVSFNNLSGTIPNGGQFDRFQNNPYQGNPGLRRDPNLALPPPLQPSENTGEPEDTEVVVFDKTEWMIIAIGFGGGLVVGVVLGNELVARKPEWFVKLFRSARMFNWL